MENLFLLNDFEVIQNFTNQNPKKEDYYDIISESDPEFFRKNNIDLKDAKIQNPWYLEQLRKQEEIEKRYDIEIPDGFKEIELYDENKSFEENFSIGKDTKYILTKVTKEDGFEIGTPDFFLPTSLHKCLIDVKKIDLYCSITFLPVNYEALFSLHLLSFINYADFFLIDERIMFEALLIKFKCFDYKPFYWSKEKILEEVGIKKDRSTKILERFLKLGILSKELRKSVIKNRPMQINYYDLDADRIVELLPEIYKEKDDNGLESKIKKYLMPVLYKNREITGVMQ